MFSRFFYKLKQEEFLTGEGEVNFKTGEVLKPTVSFRKRSQSNEFLVERHVGLLLGKFFDVIHTMAY